MKNNYVFDTNFISSLLNRHDENHRKALKIFDNLPQICNFYMPDTVYLELIIFQVKHHENIKIDLKSFIAAMKTNRLAIDEEFMDNFYNFCQKTNLNLKTIDYTVLYFAIYNNAVLLSFDEKLLKAHQKIN